jgi:hypothetical protein
LEETGNYVLNSILVHLLLLGSFRLVLGMVRSPAPSTLGVAMAQKQLPSWAWQHRYLIVFYYSASLLLGWFLGPSAASRNGTGESELGSQIIVG